MTRDEPSNEVLRDAFASDDRPAPAGAACPAPERIWDAAHANLPPREAREVVRHVAACPACAADWRLALRDSGRSEVREPAGASRVPGWTRVLGAAAVLAVAGWLGVRTWKGPDTVTGFREARAVAIESLIPEDAPLGRDRPTLRWTPAIEGTAYRLELSLADLTPLRTEHALVASEYTIPPELLDRIPPGARIVWRVEARLPDGEIVGSSAFVNRLD